MPVDQEDPLEKEMAAHCSIVAWRISRTEEPGRLQSMGSQRVRHNAVTRQQRPQKSFTATMPSFRSFIVPPVSQASPDTGVAASTNALTTVRGEQI